MITLALNTRGRLKRYGIAFIIIGSFSVIVNIIVLFKEVTPNRIGNLLVGVWFVVFGVLMVLGKGFKLED